MLPEVLKHDKHALVPPPHVPLAERLITPSDDEGACEVFLKVFTGPPGPTPASLLKNIKDTKVQEDWSVPLILW